MSLALLHPGRRKAAPCSKERTISVSDRTFETGREEENVTRALLVGVNLNEDPDFAASMDELESLAVACRMEVAGRMEQNLSVPNPAYYIGSGKVREVQEAVTALGIGCVIFEDALSPSQLKNLQKEIQAPIMDRTNLILEIFSGRAQTREARLQVESASLQYMLPRLVGMRESLGRQGGTSGSMSNKGTGEKKLELDRRKIEKRISELRRELDGIEHDREVQRRKRGQSALPGVALVGYTNAGKSTLMNALMEAYGGRDEKMVEAKDMLFATLDTTVRRISPGDKKDFLLSDTVGFINKLPHGLVKAFRSTLDEARCADLLLEVVDVSDDRYRDHMKVTRDTLRELGADQIPCIHVMNKADLVMSCDRLPRVDGDRIYMSAAGGWGLEALLEMINRVIYAGNRKCDFLIPYERGDLAGLLNENATILNREYLPEGVRLTAECPEAIFRKYERFIVKQDDKNNPGIDKKSSSDR